MKRFGDSARLALLLAGVCTAPFALCEPAMAQSSTEQATSEDDNTIVVTARRREESLQDVPIAVSVQSAEQLDQHGAQDITALGQVTPNTTIQIARGSNSTLIGFIRGVGQQDPLWGFEPGVGLYVDDVYVARPQAAVLDIFDIQRTEVLRGPQGTLYGRNTIGGAIKYVTRPLDFTQPHFTARVNVGSYGQLDAIVTGSAPLTDTFAVGGAIASYNRDGFGENLTTGADHYNKDVGAYRFSAEWNPTSALSVRLTADSVNDDSNPRNGHREAPWIVGGTPVPNYGVLSDVYDTRAGAGDKNHVQTRGAALHVDYRINDQWTLRSISAHRDGETNGTIDFDNTANPTLDVPAFYKDNQDTQEFQLLYAGDKLQLVSGLFYLDGMSRGAFDTVVGNLNLTLFTAGRVKTESYAAFADASYNLTDTLAISLGGRWTHDEKTGSVYRQNYTGIRSPFFGNASATPGLVRTNYTNSATFEEFTPRASITWEPSDEWTFYASYNRGFKSGGFDMRGDAVLTPATVNGYKPEYVDAYELGFHSSLFHNRARVSGDIFYSDYQDIQITRQEGTVTGAVASFVDNAASATAKGVELEGNFFLTNNLTANLALGYFDGKYNEYHSFTVVSGVLTPIDLSGSAKFQNTPDWTGSASFTYSVPFASGQLAFTPSAAYRGDSRMFEFATPLIDQPAYWLYNASLTWTSDNDRIRLGLHGLNLADERYRVGGYNFPGDTYGNSIIGFYGPPRTVTASVEFRY